MCLNATNRLNTTTNDLTYMFLSDKNEQYISYLNENSDYNDLVIIFTVTIF